MTSAITNTNADIDTTSAPLVQPPQDPDDEPTISPSLLQYIHSRNESSNCYSRFFDALLIPKSSHGQFFHDLKTFREQSAIIALLEPGTSEAYRACTCSFIGSRFAHPWCRTNSDFKSGWTRASWVGGTKKVTKEDKKEEERLHRLLVPLWIAFRRRMFPSAEELEEWVQKENERERERRARAEAERERRSTDPSRQTPSVTPPSTIVHPELGFTTKSASSSSNSTWTPPPSNSGAAVASKMFLGLAVTGFIMSDKRVRKYVEKKVKKDQKK